MTDLESTQQLYSSINIAYGSADGYFLPPGKFGTDNMVPCKYVSFFSADGNRITHYYTLAGVYWTTLTGHIPAL